MPDHSPEIAALRAEVGDLRAQIHALLAMSDGGALSRSTNQDLSDVIAFSRRAEQELSELRQTVRAFHPETIRAQVSSEVSALLPPRLQQSEDLLVDAVGDALGRTRKTILSETRGMLAGALSDVAIARQLASAPAEVSEALVRDAIHSWCLGDGGARAAQTKCERAVKGLFALLDRRADALATRIHETPPRSASPGELMVAMTKAQDAVTNPEAEAATLRADAERELERILGAYDTELSHGDVLASIPGHVARGEALDQRLDPSVRAAAITLRRAASTGHNVVPLCEDLDHKLLAALSDGRDFRDRMSRRWQMGIKVAAANAASKVLTRAVEVGGNAGLQRALKAVETERDELSYQYRTTFPRNTK